MVAPKSFRLEYVAKLHSVTSWKTVVIRLWPSPRKNRLKLILV